MKKLMIAAVALVAAVAAQAASVTWSTTKATVKGYSGSALAGGTVYVVDTGNAAYAALIAGLTDGTITAAKISDNAAYVSSGTTGTGSKGAGKIDATDGSNAGFVAGSNYNLAYIVFDSAADTDYFYVSTTQQAKAWSTDSEKSLATQATWTTDSAAGSWTAVSTPEPTSGLLLLIGMAGLALKRKRA